MNSVERFGDISVAIVEADFHRRHSTSWGGEWINFCVENGIRHELIDWHALGSFEKLRRHNVVLWHFSHYSQAEMDFARSILLALEASGCEVFPANSESLHFDDKVAQAYLLKALDVPTPRNYPLHSSSAVEEWITREGRFPVVAKLRKGSGSSNVKLIDSASELRSYANRMFGRGVPCRPGLFYKVRSNVLSSKSLAVLVARAKRAPEFIFSRKNASRLARERGYVYLQEFVPDLKHDLKIVVVGDKLGFIGREVRAGDFRASGGGALCYDRSLVSKKVIDLAFFAAHRLGTVCMGFDIVVDRDNEPFIIEMSYGFSHSAVLASNGHFDRSGQWHEKPLNVPVEILKFLCNKIREENSCSVLL